MTNRKGRPEKIMYTDSNRRKQNKADTKLQGHS